ncbi:MAG: hypothetical protein Q9178_002118 [Gyalolechia marmorata]
MEGSPLKRRRISPATSPSSHSVRPASLTAVPVISRCSPKSSLAKANRPVSKSPLQTNRSPLARKRLKLLHQPAILGQHKAPCGYRECWPEENEGCLLQVVHSPSPRASPPTADNVCCENHVARSDSEALSADSISQAVSGRKQTNLRAQIPATPTRHKPALIEDREPILPLTPVQLGLEPLPELPAGLSSHNASGNSTKRPGLTSKSSPLKPRGPASCGPSIIIPKGATSTQRRTSKSSPLKPQTSHATSLNYNTSERRIFKADHKTNSDFVERVLHAENQIQIAFLTKEDKTCDIESSSPQNGFSVQLRLWLNHAGDAAQNLSFYGVSQWAGAEIGPNLHDLAKQNGLDCMREAAMSYWLLEEERARCWAQCERSLTGVILEHNDQDPLSADVPGPTPISRPKSPPRRGRQNLLICRDGITLLIRWRIVLDKTKQRFMRSVKLGVFFENDDTETDGDHSLGTEQASELFNALIASGKDVCDVIETIVEILFSKETPSN